MNRASLALHGHVLSTCVQCRHKSSACNAFHSILASLFSLSALGMSWSECHRAQLALGVNFVSETRA